MNTKDNPGCRHDLRNYLHKKTGIPLTEMKILKKRMTIKDARIQRKKLGGRLYVRSADGSWILAPDQKQLKGGGGFVLHFGPDDTNYLPISTLFEFAIESPRSAFEFGIDIKQAGSYKDSLGGGWHQNVALWLVDGQYFADMDCSC